MKYLGVAVVLVLGFVVCARDGAYAHSTDHAHSTDQNREQTPWQRASLWPDRIVATIEGDSARSISVSWRTAASVTATRAEIAPALPAPRFDKAAQSVDALTQVLDLSQIHIGDAIQPIEHNEGLPRTSHHSVRFDGLEPNTLYAYRLQGAEGHWSEWFHTRTAPDGGPIRFIYFGDAQNGLDSHWPRVIRTAFQTAPDARFMLHAGDLVNRGSRDLEWAHWFRAGGFIHGMIPAILVAGNHEYDRYTLANDERQRLLSILWRPQFRLPVEAALPEDLHETVYQIRYSPDLHIFVLNTNADDMSAQAAWLDGHLTASDARWRIVSMHHPVFSSGRGRDNASRREVILPVVLRHEVDLVLQGHDHTYARGSLSANDQVPERRAATQDGAVTTMFVNSVSGSKQYEFSEDGWEKYAPSGVTLDRRAENTQFFQVIEIVGNALRYTAYMADGALYDIFQIRKSDSGDKRLVATDATLPQERRFENTIPYERVGN